MFRISDHWFKLVLGSLIREGDLNLISEYLIIGLGGGFKDLHKYLEHPENVTGSAHVARTYTGSYKGVRVTTLAIAGGGVYSEWVMALAYRRKAKAIVGVGWCGALAEHVNVGDVIIPIAAVRDEDTSDHYVEKGYPAIADFDLTKIVDEIFKEIAPSVKIHKGIIITTSSTFTESLEWGKAWSTKNVIGVDCETSVIYTLASLLNIPVVNLLIVSDHVTKPGYSKVSWERIRDDVLKVAYEAMLKASNTLSCC